MRITLTSLWNPETVAGEALARTVALFVKFAIRRAVNLNTQRAYAAGIWQ